MKKPSQIFEEACLDLEIIDTKQVHLVILKMRLYMRSLLF